MKICIMLLILVVLKAQAQQVQPALVKDNYQSGVNVGNERRSQGNLDSRLSPGDATNPEDVITSREIEEKVRNRVKDPFMIPNRLYVKVKKISAGDEYVDETVPPPRRWSLKHYNVVGIIWKVSNPKAMIKDKKGDIHIFLENDRIANNNGRIKSISNGEVVVKENGVDIKLKLNK